MAPRKCLAPLLGCFLLAAALLGCSRRSALTQSEKLDLFGRTWGLLKYYHPNVGAGDISWDSVFVADAAHVLATNSDEDFRQAISALVASAGPFTPIASPTSCAPLSDRPSVDFSWVNTDVFADQDAEMLHSLLSNPTTYRNRYVTDSVETRSLGYARFYEDPLAEADLGRPEVRLLALFRFWNIVEYFYPYKELTDTGWDSVLAEYIPRFLNASTDEAYYEELVLLSAELNDGHASIPFHPELRRQLFGSITVPFKVQFVGDDLVVNEITAQRLTEPLGIRLGDVIVQIDGQPVAARREYLRERVPNPTAGFQNLEISRYILNGHSDSVSVTIGRDGRPTELIVPRLSFAELREHRDEPTSHIPWSIADNVGYAHMGNLGPADLADFFDAVKDSDGLILDFRHYPRWEVFHEFLGHVYVSRQPFVATKTQCLDRPGFFKWVESDGDLSNVSLRDDRYRNPIVVLVDENTLSFGEYFAMALQVLDSVTVVGRQTAGFDGNQVGVDMPGGMRMFLSSLGIYYPDRGETQRVGIRLDSTVAVTTADIASGNDPVMNLALDLLAR